MFHETDAGQRRARGFAFGILGSFIVAFSTVVILVTTPLIGYAFVVATSLLAILMVYLAFRSGRTHHQVILVVFTGVVLTIEASVVVLYLGSASGGAYSVATLIGSLIALKGIRDIESIRRVQQPIFGRDISSP